MLGRRLDLFRSPQFKELRRTLHPLIEEHTRRDGNTPSLANNEAQYLKSLTSRISGALMDGRFDDSQQLLIDFKKSGQKMKLGTVQRWVRDININTLKPDPLKVRILDLVLRCTPEFEEFGLHEDEVGRGFIYFKEEWAPSPLKDKPEGESETFTPETYRRVKFEKADERQPRNYFDLSIYTNMVEFVFSSC